VLKYIFFLSPAKLNFPKTETWCVVNFGLHYIIILI